MRFKGIVITVIIGMLAFFGAIYTLSHLTKVDVARLGVVYSMKGGVKDEPLTQGYHFISPFEHVKEFTIGNEQLLLTKDKREGSKEDESFNVTTKDNASIPISLEMSYRFIPERVVETYKSFKLDGEQIIQQRARTKLKADCSDITSKYTLMEVYSSQRTEINEKLTKHLGEIYRDRYGIEVISASIIDVHPNKELAEAINEKVKALQNKEKAVAEQETIKVQKQTELLQAQADGEIKKAKAEADAAVIIEKADAQAKANKKIADSITPELIKMKEAEARLEHGWVTIQGVDAIVTDKK